MDQDGLFLMLKMCNGCSHNKGSWKKCMSRRHNPRMSTVRKEELTFGHRQCVKPDQAITIYKLRDHETNEEFLEFDEQVIFQTACPACLNIKSCLKSGHKLVDWRPTFAGGRVAGTPLSPPPSPRRVTPPDVAPGGRGGRGRKKEGEGVKGGPASGGRNKGGRRRSSAGAAGAAADDDDGGGGGGDGDDDDDGDATGGGAGGAGMKVSSPSRRARGSLEGTPHAKAAPKSSHKRKSPGSSASDLAKNLKISAPRSVSVPEIPKPASLAANKPSARRGRGNNSGNTAPGGTTKRNRRKSGEAAGVTPKMEIDTSASSSEANERPLKRRGKQALPAAVTPSPKTEGQESFQACSAGEEEEDEEGEEEAAPHGDEGVVATPTIVAKIVPKTVAEKLEMVKNEEAELLRQFEDTHNRCAQEEEAKRAEMVEFQRAGEAALCAMQEEKEELLRRISEERKTKAAERGALLRERLKEFEAEEAASRAEAKERDARLEAEKEMLSRECKADLASTAAAAAAAAAGPLSSFGNGEWMAPSGGGGDGSVGNENGTCGTGTDPDAPASSKTSEEARASSAAAAAAMAEAQAAMSMSMSMSMSTTSMSTSTIATVEESADDDLAERNGTSSAADLSACSKAALLTEEATKSSKRASSPAKAVLSGRGAGKACNGGVLSSTRSSAAVATASLAKAGPGGGGGEGMNFDAPGVELVSPDVSEPETGFPYEGGVVPADEDAPGSATDTPDEVGNAERDGEEGRANGVSPGVGRSKGPSSVAVQ